MRKEESSLGYIGQEGFGFGIAQFGRKRTKSKETEAKTEKEEELREVREVTSRRCASNGMENHSYNDSRWSGGNGRGCFRARNRGLQIEARKRVKHLQTEDVS